jgi:hypothetical protein
VATTKTILDYTIYLPDKDVVAERQASVSKIRLFGPNLFLNYSAAGNGFIFCAPDYASTLFNAPVRTVFAAAQNPPETPVITSPWITESPNVNFDTSKDTIEVKSGGWFGIPALFGDTAIFMWRGNFVYKPAGPQIDGTDVGSPALIPARRWIHGFEIDEARTDTADNANQSRARDAGRSVGAFGLLLSGTGSSSTLDYNVADYNPGFTTNASWERFYFRPRSAWPTTSARFWRARCSTGSVQLHLTPTGNIAVFATGSTTDLLAQSLQPLVLEKWHKIDVLLTTGSAAKIEVYVNGKLQITVTGFPSGGISTTNVTHTGSSINRENVAGMAWTWDFDDWFNAAQPVTKDSIDWLNGTRIVCPRAASLAASHDTPNWNGYLPEVLNQRNFHSQTPDVTVGGVSGSRLAIRLATDYKSPRDFGASGAMAVTVTAFKTGSNATQPNVGYSVAGGGAVVSAVTTLATSNHGARTVFAAGGGSATPAALDPVELYYEHSPDNHNESVAFLAAQIEMIGIYGPEDVSAQSVPNSDVTVPINKGQHIAPYPLSPWALSNAAPISPVGIVGGTYVGNGVLTTLTFKFPVTFLVIRNVSTAGSGHNWWWTTLNGAHAGHTFALDEAGVVRCQYATANPAAEDDQTTQTTIYIGGAGVKHNANGETYQYIVYCDPGGRFTLNAALADNWSPEGRVTKFLNTNFLAEFLMLLQDRALNNSTNALFTKGPGNAATEMSSAAATAALAAALTVATGQVTMGADLVSAVALQAALAMWRRNDGSGDPGIPKAVAIGSYTGDGAASRTITIAPASGLRPMWALVVPNNTSAAIFRDPSNAATESNQSSSTAYSKVTTGITAGGIDQFTVGSSLNGNGVVYNWIVFPGLTTAGNGGWSDNGENIPVEPAIPVDGPWDPQPTGDDPDDPDDGGGDGGDGGSYPGTGDNPPGEDFGTQCVPASQKVCNQALAFCGVSQLITDIVHEATPEANLCRLHYEDAVLAVLREHPWPFATKYAALVLVAGSPDARVNDDWIYAYRKPADLVFPRRVVRPGFARRFDPEPPPFREGVDPTGGLIYSDQPDAVLEYTFRPTCAAGDGDALFREALMYKVAQKIAPSIARDEKKVDRAAGLYERALNVAATRSERGQQQQRPSDGDAEWIRARQ